MEIWDLKHAQFIVQSLSQMFDDWAFDDDISNELDHFLLGMGNGIICARMTRFLNLRSKTFLCGNKIFLLMFLMNNQDIMIYPWQP